MTYRGSAIRPSVPKPYDFVPVAEVKRFETPGHQQIIYSPEYFSGRLIFEIQALSPVFVSNGRYALSEELGLKPGLAVRGFYHLQGQPAIPASSLKGLVRNVAEAVSPSCVTTTRTDKSLLAAGNVTNTDQCRIGPDDKGRLQQACPACALFGGGGRNAHIGLARFEDVRLVEGGQTEMRRMAPLYGPRVTFRQTPQVYLSSRGSFKGRKFYFHGQTAQVGETEGDLCEVIPEGARLAGSLSFINLNGPLLGVLLFALGLDDTFRLKLGGGQPACFGSVEIIPGHLWRDQGAGFSQAERSGDTLTGEALAQFVTEQIALAEKEEWLLEPQMRKLREILRFPNPRECPTGLY